MSDLEQLRDAVGVFMDIELRPDAPVDNYNLVAGRLHHMVMAILACEASGIPKEEILEVLTPARERHGEAPFIHRCQTWPRGFPGDYETIEALYHAKNHAPPNTIAYYCEEYALLCASTQQHRNKLRYQSDLVLRALAQHKASNDKDCPMRVLSLAGGSFIDLQMIAASLVGEPVTFVLNDTDPEALSFAKEKLGALAAQCQLMEGNVVEFLAWEAEELGAFDLVLTGGLFDYLEPKHITYILRAARNGLVAPGGRFFFTNVARHNPYRPWMEYLADWVLIERNEEELLAIIEKAKIPREAVHIERDLTRVTCLVSISF